MLRQNPGLVQFSPRCGLHWVIALTSCALRFGHMRESRLAIVSSLLAELGTCANASYEAVPLIYNMI